MVYMTVLPETKEGQNLLRGCCLASTTMARLTRLFPVQMPVLQQWREAKKSTMMSSVSLRGI